MREVWIIGTACTTFGKMPGASFAALAREVCRDALADGGLGDSRAVEGAWFANCGMGSFGQRNIRGQACLGPLQREGLLPDRLPIVNVEGGCASASLALAGACREVASGEAEVALAIGVEKTFVPEDPARTREIFDGGIDRLEPAIWHEYFRRHASALGMVFDPTPAEGTVFMQTYALQARWHMHRHGTTQRQIAAAAAKTHHHASLNPRAQYRFSLTIEEVLADRVIAWPLTRAMCAPISDGAAAAIVCSRDFLDGCDARARERAVRVRAIASAGGKYRHPAEPSLSRAAAAKAYARSGLTPSDVDVVEVHDATSFCELYQLEMLGLCAEGRAGAFIESGEAALGGRLPVNLSGGLVGKGHPVGATGLSMIHELVLQLRGEAGQRQAGRARIGLSENGGGVIGFDEAICTVTLLEGRT